MKGRIRYLTDQETEEMRREALEFLGIGLYRYRFDGTVVFMDPGAMHALGVDQVYPDSESVVGKDIGDLIVYDGPRGYLRNQIRAEGKAHGLEYPFKTLRGEERCAVHDSYLVQDPETGEELIQVIIKDITDQKRAERALRQEREQLAVTLRSIGDGVITADVEGRVALLNKSAEELTGWTQEEAVSRPLEEVFPLINEHTRERCENPVTKVLETGQIVGLANHTVLIRRDGTELIIADSGAPIRDSQSRVIGVVLVFRDITRQQKLELDAQRVERLESVGVLAGGIAHDFNNLLSTILGNVGLARLYCPPTHKSYDLLVQAEKATLRAKDLTHQLLTFAKGGTPVRTAGNVEAVVREAAGFALSGSSCAAKMDFPPDLRAVDLDVGQIGQVIHNLVINAVQAMDSRGTIHISAGNLSLGLEESSLSPGDYVLVEVRDEGRGIPASRLSRIFDPYYSTRKDGNGLGLTIAHSIIRAHDGHIAVRSVEGAGTTFSFYLPACPHEGLVEGTGTGDLLSGTGRILVMDDEESLREMVGAMLAHLGYSPAFAEDGERAVSIYRDAFESGEPFDAVILDLTIPGGTGGAEAVRRIRTINPDVLAIASSGYSSDPIMSDYQDFGFSAALPKPYTIAEFSRVLRKVLRAKPGP